MNNLLKILSILVLIFFSQSYSQKIPTSFSKKSNKLNKVSADPNPSGNSVEYIQFMGDDVWIATSVGLSKSTDGGDSWTNYKFGTEGISALAIKNDTVWTATWHLGNYPNAADEDAVGSGIHYSSDKGETWIDIEQPQDDLIDTVLIYGSNKIKNLVWANPVYNLTRSIDFQNNTIWVANYFAGLYKSENFGVTWDKVVLPPDSLNEITPDSLYDFVVSSNNSSLIGSKANLNHVIFSLKVVDDSTIVVGTAGGINLSIDGGVSWRKFNHFNQLNPISGNRILDIEFNEANNSIWAATWRADSLNEYFGLSSSFDMGENWNTYLSGENIHDIAFTYDSGGNESDVIVASDNGVFRSKDLGNSWTLAPQIRDDITNLPLTTTKFRAINTNLDINGINNIWFGSESGSAMLIESGGLWKGEWKVFVSAPKLSSNTEAFAFPNPFTPDEEPIKIKYSFSGDTKSVTIRIFDFGMNLVRTVIQNVSRIGGNEFIDNWDGKDENNTIVPNGVYFFRIDIGNGEPLFGKIIVLM